MNLVDTSGWIEYFFEGEGAEFFAPAVEATSESIVPTVCLYEVFKKVNAVADQSRALQAVSQMKQGRVVDLTEDVALSAALVSLKHTLPMADALIYATAKAHDAVLWTQDEHFRTLPGVRFRQAGADPRRKSKRRR